MDDADNRATLQLMYRDAFGELSIERENRLVWRSASQWWDDSDDARWRKLAELNHPAIARVQASHRDAVQLSLEFQCPPGRPLSELIASAGSSPALDALDGLALLVQLASAFEVMHSLNFFGLNLTPTTVFVNADNANSSFVFVPVPAPISPKRLHPEDFLRVEEPAAVLPYIAQERLRSRLVSLQADVYSLGIVGYQVLCSARLPVYADKATLIRASVAGEFQSQIAPTETGAAYHIIRQCLVRRPSRRPKVSDVRAGLASALRETLCQPCELARQQRELGNLQGAIDILSAAMQDPIRERNPQLYLMSAEITAQMKAADPLAVIAAGRAAADRVERLLDEKQMTSPLDRYFTMHLFASPSDVQLTARQIYRLLGNIYQQENLLQKAIAQYDRALQLAGDDGALLLDYAVTLRQADRPGEALRALERAEKMGGADYRLLQIEKARAMERQGMLDQAIDAYQIALHIAPDGATWTQLGKLYLPKGADVRHKAEHAFKQAIKIDMYQLEAAAYLADLALDQNDEEAALAALGAVRLPSDMSLITLSVLNNYLQMVDDLSRRMSSRLRQNRDDPAVHRLLGDLYLLRARMVDDPNEAQRFHQASEDYLRALLSYEVSLGIDNEQPELLKKVQAIQEPLIHEQSDLEYRIQEGDVAVNTYNRLALVDWRLATIAAGHDRHSAIAHLTRAVELLEMSVQQDMGQREIRRLWIALAEQLRSAKGGD